jgi:hypothetical protein
MSTIALSIWWPSPFKGWRRQILLRWSGASNWIFIQKEGRERQWKWEAVGSLLWMAFTKGLLWLAQWWWCLLHALFSRGSKIHSCGCMSQKKCFFVSDSKRGGGGAGNHFGVTNVKIQQLREDWYISGKMIQFINLHTWKSNNTRWWNEFPMNSSWASLQYN